MTKKQKTPRKMNFINKVKWLFSNNPKHQMNQKVNELDEKGKQVKQLEKQLKINVDKLQNQTIKLAQLQKHFHTNHEKTLKETKELKEFKKEKKEIEHTIKILHNFIGHIPDNIADEFVNSKEFSRFQRTLCKHFKDYEL